MELTKANPREPAASLQRCPRADRGPHRPGAGRRHRPYGLPNRRPGKGQEFSASAFGETLGIILGSGGVAALGQSDLTPEGMAIELLEAKRSTAGSHEAFCRYLDEQIGLIILDDAPGAKDSGGALASAAILRNEVRLELVAADADLLSATLNQTLLTWITELNVLDALPPTVWRDVKPAEDLKARSERDKNLASLGYRPTRKHVQEVYGGELDASMRELLRPVAVMLAKGGSPEHALTRLAEIYPDLDATDLATIYRTNMQSSDMAGRYQRFAENAAARPFWEYVSVMDSRTRPEHAALNGLVFPAGDPFWDSYWPLNGWRCRCRVSALTRGEAHAEGRTVQDSSGRMAEKEVPIGRAKPGQPVPMAKVARFEARPCLLARRMGVSATIRARLRRACRKWWTASWRKHRRTWPPRPRASCAKGTGRD